MKKYLIIISLFMTLTTMTAQETYRSIFGDNFTSFNIMETIPDGGDRTDSFYYARDTVLNDILYKQFFRTRAHHSNKNNSNDVSESFLLRENEDRSKVFLRILNGEWPYYVEDESMEFLVMDLALNIQDTFTIRTDKYSRSLIATNVFFDDEGRKHIKFNQELLVNIPFEFIEGVGTNMGLFYMGEDIFNFANYGLCLTYLLCVFQDDKHIYTAPPPWYPLTETCSYFSENNISEKRKETINIFPNPAHNSMTIELGDSYCDYQSITIFDLLGRERMNISVTQSRQTISTQSLQNGYYLLRINSDKKNNIHKKLLITK